MTDSNSTEGTLDYGETPESEETTEYEGTLDYGATPEYEGTLDSEGTSEYEETPPESHKSHANRSMSPEPNSLQNKPADAMRNFLQIQTGILQINSNVLQIQQQQQVQNQQNHQQHQSDAESNGQISPQNSGVQGPTEQCSNNTRDAMEEIDDIISSIVGLDGVKLQMRKWLKGLILYEKRKILGIKIGPRKTLHMAFLGNPGTGKTMVARLLGKILHKLGLISNEKVTEVQRTDLVGEYVGQTGVKTRTKIEEASGGILFIDEAYRLMPRNIKTDFGIEALEEIMSAMDKGDIVTIFAGYSEEMKRVITANAGFSRRVSKFFYFDDYSPKDIAIILQSKMKAQKENSFLYGFKLHPDCTVPAVAELIQEHITKEQLKKLNGGLVDPLLVNARESLDLRLDVGCIDIDILTTITMKDLEEGLITLSNRKKKARKDEDDHTFIS